MLLQPSRSAHDTLWQTPAINAAECEAIVASDFSITLPNGADISIGRGERVVIVERLATSRTEPSVVVRLVNGDSACDKGGVFTIPTRLLTCLPTSGEC